MNEKAKTPEAETARVLFAQPCTCLLAAAAVDQFPLSQGKKALAEVALIGRSNVGKSSLINALTGRHDLARASNTPGRTQQIVFFDLGGRLMLVDLPGYGHATAPKALQRSWTALTNTYLQTRPNLRLVCLLVDSRHGIMANDTEMMKFLDRAGVAYRIILTKADQIKTAEHEGKLRQVTAQLPRHPAANPHVLLTSAEKKTGMQELREILAAFARP